MTSSIALQNLTVTSAAASSPHPDQATNVYIRLVFLRIGEIDTLTEKYQAHVSIESRWEVSLRQFSSAEHDRLMQGKSLTLDKYAETHWHPQLYIENGLGDTKEQIKYTAKLNRHDGRVYLCEHRIVKGLFWEKLELHHFPSDVQDLSVSVTSMLFNDKVELWPDLYCLSGVNREAFVDQQEWSLYEHVDAERRSVNDFVYQVGDQDDEMDSAHDHQTQAQKEGRQRSVLTVTCHAARQSDYFFWNGYFLIFMITFVSFCTFAMPMQVAINRLQVSCTLLLTSITFRWTMNRSLPMISYLTSLDKYGILCMVNLVLHSIWHGVVSALAWTYTTDYRAGSDHWIANIDHIAFYVSIGVFIIIHVVLIIWLFAVPLRHRKILQRKDNRYRKEMLAMKTRSSNRFFPQLPRTVDQIVKDSF